MLYQQNSETLKKITLLLVEMDLLPTIESAK